MATVLDFEKLRSNKNIGIWLGPSGGATGIQNVDLPTAAEINNTGGTSAMINAAPAVSWNDYDFGVTDAETTNDPSFADESTFEDLGPAQYGGSVSFYYPGNYDDVSNTLSNVYDLTDIPWENVDIALRIDGEKNNISVPAANGDFVHTFRTWVDSEANVLEADNAYRRTVGFQMAGESAFYTVVGAHTITAVPPASTPWAVGKKARLRATVQDRDYTNALSFQSSDPDVVKVFPGGFYEVVGADTDTATITISDERAGTTQTVSVVVTA